jgi:Flp pilus assembly protein TadG
MTELVIVLPIALILVMAVAELGQAFMQYNTLTKALRDGARHAAGNALLGSTGTVDLNAQLVEEIRNLVVYGNVHGDGDGANRPLLPDFQPEQVAVEDAGANSVRVGASYPYQPIFSRLPMLMFGSDVSTNFTLEAAIVMRAL